jgi:hypothetical protein
MKVILTEEESLEFFYNALCNAVGTGYILNHGIELIYDVTEYKTAKSKLTSPCFEDVLIQILKDGGTLTMEDVEGDGDMTKSITIKDVYEKVQLTPFEHLSNMINENDDAETADVILQTVFYGEVIFG